MHQKDITWPEKKKLYNLCLCLNDWTETEKNYKEMENTKIRDQRTGLNISIAESASWLWQKQ